MANTDNTGGTGRNKKTVAPGCVAHSVLRRVPRFLNDCDRSPCLHLAMNVLHYATRFCRKNGKTKEAADQKIKKLATPREIYSYLHDYVIGQDSQKRPGGGGL